MLAQERLPSGERRTALNDRPNQPRAFISGLAPGRVIAQLTESRIPPPPAHDLANRWRPSSPSGRRSAHPLAAVSCQTRQAGFVHRSAKGMPRPIARIRLQPSKKPRRIHATLAVPATQSLARLMRPPCDALPVGDTFKRDLNEPTVPSGECPVAGADGCNRLQPAAPTRSGIILTASLLAGSRARASGSVVKATACCDSSTRGPTSALREKRAHDRPPIPTRSGHEVKMTAPGVSQPPVAVREYDCFGRRTA